MDNSALGMIRVSITANTAKQLVVLFIVMTFIFSTNIAHNNSQIHCK